MGVWCSGHSVFASRRRFFAAVACRRQLLIALALPRLYRVGLTGTVVFRTLRVDLPLRATPQAKRPVYRKVGYVPVRSKNTIGLVRTYRIR